MEQSKDLDLTDEEYRILDTVSKDINMIQLLYKIPKKKLNKLLKYCTNHCNSYVFKMALKQPKINMNLSFPMNHYVKLYNRKHNIIVYLLGEDHSNTNKCRSNVNSFLKKLSDYPYLVDIFSELPRYILKTDSKLGSRSLEMLRQFHQLSKDSVNIRTHEADLRSIIDYHPSHFQVSSDLSWQRDYVVPEEFMREGMRPITDVVINRIYKQISKIYDPMYREIIKDISDENMRYFSELRDRIMKTRKYTTEEILSMITFTDPDNRKSLIDSYILARMHRDFEKKDIITKNCSSRPHNVIYVAGHGHTVIMKHYLRQLDYEILVDVFSDERCNRTNDNLPLFFRPEQN